MNRIVLDLCIEDKVFVQKEEETEPSLLSLKLSVNCSWDMTFPVSGSAMQFPEIREEVEEEAVTPQVTIINSFTRILLDYDIISSL